eukprot:scaffold11651_cov118-Isochrysis_galbana.AAC.9
MDSSGAVGCRARAEMHGEAVRCESMGAAQRGSPSTDAPVGVGPSLQARHTPGEFGARAGGGARRGSTSHTAPVAEAAARRG